MLSPQVLRLFFAVSCWMISCAGMSQSTPWHYKLTVGDGLSGNIVKCVLQGPQGRMWFGTSQGLSVYDGHAFENFLPGKEIVDLAIASDSVVLITCVGGVYQYNTIQGNLRKHVLLSAHQIRRLTEYHDDKLLVASRDSLFLYKPQGNLDYVFELAPFITSDMIQSSAYISDVAAADDGSIWVAGLQAGSIHLDSNFQLIRHHTTKSWPVSFQLSPDSPVFFSSEYQLRVQHPKTGQFLLAKEADSLLSPPKERILQNFLPKYAISTSNKVRWYTSDSERTLLRFDTRSSRYTTLLLNDIDFSKTQCLYEGRNGILWLGTEHGVVMLHTAQKQVAKFLDRPGTKTPLASIRGMVEDDAGRLYIATYSGIFLLEPERDTIYPLPNVKESKLGKRIYTRCYAFLREGNDIWIATESFGLFRYQIEQQNFIKYTSGQEEWSLGMSLLRDHQKQLWMGARNGLYKVNEQDKTVEKIQLDLDLKSRLAIYDLHEDQGGRMWLATNFGLYQYAPEEDRVLAHYHTAASPGAQLSHDIVLDIHEDASGMLWLATKGGGICRLDADSGTVKAYTQFESIDASSMVASILEDEQGMLWLGTFNGLVRFDKRTGETRTYLSEDGLSHSEFNHKAAFRRKNGQLIFGGIQGINLLDPKNWDETDQQASLLVRTLSAYDNELGDFTDHTSNAIQAQTIDWPASITHFVLQFALTDYTHPERNRYAYKITGWIDEWQDLGGQNEIRINTPPAGNYQLMVKGMGGAGIWSAPLVIDLQIAPAFYERIEFWVASLLGLIFLIVGAVRWRLRRLTREKQRLETEVQNRTREIAEQKARIEQQAEQLLELDQLKSRFFANVSHELRTPLTLINGYIDRLFHSAKDNQRKELEIALRNGKQLQKLVEEILDLSKIDSSKIDLTPRDIELKPFLEVLMDGFRSDAEHRSIRFSLHMAETCPSHFRVDDNKLGKVLNNLLSNALKFTPNEGKVQLSVDVEGTREQQLVFRVIDTGRGIHPDDLPHIFDRYYQTGQSNLPLEGGTGIGLAFSQELSKVMQGKLIVESEWGKGSEFALSIPLLMAASPKISLPQEEPEIQQFEDEAEPEVSVKTDATLLLVEDNRDMQEFIQLALGPNFNYKLASDGVEALEVLQNTAVDLVVTDLMMPRMDGFHLVEKLKAKEETQGLPVILLTARAAMEDKLKGLTIGVDDYLTKPFDATELKVRIHNLLRNKQQREAGIIQLPPGQDKAESVDQVFVRKAHELVLEQLDNSRFGVIDLAEGLLVSQRTLSRKMKLTTGMSPLKFIHNVRLERAHQLLEERQYATVAEVMHAVGWQSGGHFARMFDERFGKKPSAFFE